MIIRQSKHAKWRQRHSRLIARLADLFVDTMTTPVDGTILRRHDRLYCALFLDVSRKSWDLGDNDDNLWRGAVIPELASADHLGLTNS